MYLPLRMCWTFTFSFLLLLICDTDLWTRIISHISDCFQWLIQRTFFLTYAPIWGKRGTSNECIQYGPKAELYMGRFLTLFFTVTVWVSSECITHIFCNLQKSFLLQLHSPHIWGVEPIWWSLWSLWSCDYCDWRFIALCLVEMQHFKAE